MKKKNNRLGDRPKVYIDLALDNYVLTRKEDNRQMQDASKLKLSFGMCAYQVEVQYQTQHKTYNLR